MKVWRQRQRSTIGIVFRRRPPISRKIWIARVHLVSRIGVSNADIQTVGKVKPVFRTCHTAVPYSEMPLQQRRPALHYPYHCLPFYRKKHSCIRIGLTNDSRNLFLPALQSNSTSFAFCIDDRSRARSRSITQLFHDPVDLSIQPNASKSSDCDRSLPPSRWKIDIGCICYLKIRCQN